MILTSQVVYKQLKLQAHMVDPVSTLMHHVLFLRQMKLDHSLQLCRF